MRDQLKADAAAAAYAQHPLRLVLKGATIGAAGVVPGVSGGTLALILHLYLPLIDALRSFDLTALGLVVRMRVGAFFEHVHLRFLIWLGLGVAGSFLTLALLLEWLLTAQPVLVFAFFFGLIGVSVYYVGRRVRRWRLGPLVGFVIGASLAASIALLAPGQENSAWWYVGLCGMVAIASMMLPGLSGSFVLILMGNYLLVIGAIGHLRIPVLIPLFIGGALGAVLFSRLLSVLFHRYHDGTIATMTGFILGSLLIIWPWKTEVYQVGRLTPGGSPVLAGYEWHIPDFGQGETWLALALVVAGAAALYWVERAALAREAPT